MKKFWEVFRYELIRNGRRKGFLFSTFGLPIFMGLLMLGFHIYQSTRSPEELNPLQSLNLEHLKNAAYVDESGLFADVPSELNSVLQAMPNEESALAALNAQEIDAYFIIGEDYLETGRVVLHMPELQIFFIDEAPQLAERLIYQTLASGLSPDYLERLGNPANFTDYTIAVNDESGEGEVATTSNEFIETQQFAIVYVFSILFFVGLMATNNYLMQTVIEERENRLIEILLSTVTANELLAGKILAMACLGLFQISVWIAGGVALFFLAGNMETYSLILTSMSIDLHPELFGLMLVYFLLMYLIFASVFGAIGAISGSVQEGSQYAGFVVLPTLLPYYFLSIFQAEPNGIVATIFTLFPLTSPLTTIARMVVTDIPTWQIAASLIIVAITAVGALWMTGRIFRVQTLLTGQKLKLKDIPKLLFSDNSPRKVKEV